MRQLQKNVLLFSQKGAEITTKISENLLNSKSVVENTYSVSKAIEFIIELKPCLIVIDTKSDDPKSIEFIKKIKKLKEDLKFNVYFLVDNNKNLEEQINLFDIGVDEFGYRDTSSILIIQRINNIINKYIEPVIELPQNPKGISIDKERYMVYKEGKEIFLPRKEFELLILLASKPLKVFTREEIFRIVWGNKSIVGDRTIDVHIRKIREKIGDRYIKTIKGVGYKFID